MEYPIRTFWPNGQLRYEDAYDEKLRLVISKSWHMNGNKRSVHQIHSNNETLIGCVKVWSSVGELSQYKFYENGGLEGEQLSI